MKSLVLLLPLLQSLLLKFNHSLSADFTAKLINASMLVTSATSLVIFYQVVIIGDTYSPIFTWFDLELLQLEFGGSYDSLAAVMLVVVSLVSTGVHMYSVEYMKEDMHLQRFLCYLSLFTFFMLVLVTANNIIQLFLGYEGVGICSYLLISFWFNRLQANKAAVKAVLVNRVGDTALAVAIFLIFKTTGSFEFSTIFMLAKEIDPNTLYIICGLIFLAAVGKSAQLGLHTWLPDAMEGPTPVSALIHAATMVTAGIFLVMRCSPLFEEAQLLLPLITVVGALTSFFAATVALVQTDLKRVIAYSTASQLGMMMTACGLSGYNISIFHLSNHAFFKALLFLTAGSIIHGLANEQDMRRMGGLANLFPFSYTMILIGSLALMGTPFLSGFYSKDAIIEIAYAQYNITGHFAFWLCSLSAGLTAFYSMRLVSLTFLGEANGRKSTIEHLHDAPLLMAIPMCALAILAIFVGYLTKDLFIGLGTPFWGNSISVSSLSYAAQLQGEFLPYIVKVVPLLCSGTGGLLGILYYRGDSSNIFTMSKVNVSLFTFLNKKWYIDKLYNELIVQHVLTLGYNLTYAKIDRGFLETFGPKGIARNIEEVGFSLANVQTGLPYHYLKDFFIGALYLVVIISTGLPLELAIVFYLCQNHVKTENPY